MVAFFFACTLALQLFFSRASQLITVFADDKDGALWLGSIANWSASLGKAIQVTTRCTSYVHLYHLARQCR
jgi:hypothetical protein